MLKIHFVLAFNFILKGTNQHKYIFFLKQNKTICRRSMRGKIATKNLSMRITEREGERKLSSEKVSQ